MILDIVQYPDLALKATSVPVDGLDWVLANARALVDTLQAKGGVGLAFPQVGVSLAGFVYCPLGTVGGERFVLNPTLKSLQRRGEFDRMENEGCLSVGEGKPRTPVLRSYRILVSYQEVEKWWAPSKARLRTVQKRELFGTDARVFQHEYDHLNGVLLGGADLDALLLKGKEATA